MMKGRFCVSRRLWIVFCGVTLTSGVATIAVLRQHDVITVPNCVDRLIAVIIRLGGVGGATVGRGTIHLGVAGRIVGRGWTQEAGRKTSGEVKGVHVRGTERTFTNPHPR